MVSKGNFRGARAFVEISERDANCFPRSWTYTARYAAYRRARRLARHRRGGGAHLSRERGLAAWRVPRRGHVLRPQRLPHHLAAHRRVAPRWAHRPAGVLAAARAAPAARTRRSPCRLPAVLRDL